jgi:putative aldouronate transport system permease protein
MYGIIMAFQEFRLGDTMGMSEWVGLQHFRDLISGPSFSRLMRNNVVMGLLRIFIGFPLPIIFAIMLNELRSVKFKKTTQTISYLPHFISWPVAAILMRNFLNVDGGTFNELMMRIGLIDEPIGFFVRSDYFWGLFLGTHIWKNLGWEAIIFVAAITGIDQELYEAASIDGASRMQKIWYITIQGIKPTIIILFILTIGSLMATSFDQIMNLTEMRSNAFLRERADILQTYVFSVGIGQRRFSFASAVGLMNTVINFTLLIGANWISRKWSETSLF